MRRRGRRICRKGTLKRLHPVNIAMKGAGRLYIFFTGRENYTAPVRAQKRLKTVKRPEMYEGDGDITHLLELLLRLPSC